MWSYSCVGMRNGLILSSFQMAVWLSQHIYYSDRLSAGLIFNSFTNSLVGQRKEGAVGAGLGWYFQVKNSPALADCRASSFYFPGVDAGARVGCKNEFLVPWQKASPTLGWWGPLWVEKYGSYLLPAKRGAEETWKRWETVAIQAEFDQSFLHLCLRDTWWSCMLFICWNSTPA